MHWKGSGDLGYRLIHRTCSIPVWTTTSVCAKHLGAWNPPICSWWGSLVVSWPHGEIPAPGPALTSESTPTPLTSTEANSMITKQCQQSATSCCTTTHGPKLRQQNVSLVNVSRSVGRGSVALETSMWSVQSREINPCYVKWARPWAV